MGSSGLTGPRGPADAPGTKGATGDPGATPHSYFEGFSHGSVPVGANEEQTGTVDCPPGTRVLSGAPTGLLIAPPAPRLTIVASEPNAAGTGWILTMRAGDLSAGFQVVATCAFVD